MILAHKYINIKISLVGRVQTGPGAHPASHTIGTVSFRGGGGVKRPGRGIDHPPTSSAKVKERVEPPRIPLLPLWAFVACYRVTFTFTVITFYAVTSLRAYPNTNDKNIFKNGIFFCLYLKLMDPL
jgi:hypothetical protein